MRSRKLTWREEAVDGLTAQSARQQEQIEALVAGQERRDKRLAYYESSNAPPSANSMEWKKQKRRGDERHKNDPDAQGTKPETSKAQTEPSEPKTASQSGAEPEDPETAGADAEPEPEPEQPDTSAPEQAEPEAGGQGTEPETSEAAEPEPQAAEPETLEPEEAEPQDRAEPLPTT